MIYGKGEGNRGQFVPPGSVDRSPFVAPDLSIFPTQHQAAEQPTQTPRHLREIIQHFKQCKVIWSQDNSRTVSEITLCLELVLCFSGSLGLEEDRSVTIPSFEVCLGKIGDRI